MGSLPSYLRFFGPFSRLFDAKCYNHYGHETFIDSDVGSLVSRSRYPLIYLTTIARCGVRSAEILRVVRLSILSLCRASDRRRLDPLALASVVLMHLQRYYATSWVLCQFVAIKHRIASIKVQPIAGFRTLWQPTVMIPASKIMPTRTTSEQDLKPSRTTKVFNWNFNDAEAAWPKVELILSTTERRAAVTKPKRKFATYFPFYLRGQASPSENNQVTAGSENESGSEKLASTEESKKDDSDEDQDVRCYSCGLDISDIPYYPSCYHVFDQKGSTHVNKKVRYMVRCINPKKKDEKKGKRRIIRKIKNYTIPEERKLYRGIQLNLYCYRLGFTQCPNLVITDNK